MFRIKICGIRRVDDATAIAQSGADAIGLNFYERSPRSIRPDRAKEIARAVRSVAAPESLAVVGVFVNASLQRIERTIEEVGLDWVQLHGDETVESYQSIGLPVVRAIRFEDLVSANRQIVEWTDWGADAILLDARSPRGYGGTGEKVDWATAAQIARPLPIVLAGGLTPQNVGQAIQTFRPDAVDTASGVESAPGIKDAALVERLVQESRRAFDSEGSENG